MKRQCGWWVAMLVMLMATGGIAIQDNLVAAQVPPVEFENLVKLSPNGKQKVSVTADNMGMQGSKIWISNIDGTGKHVLLSFE